MKNKLLVNILFASVIFLQAGATDRIKPSVRYHEGGSVWDSVANKHSAPGICTWSGHSLLKYYRATGDEQALALLTDIAHGLPQYISREECPIGNMPPGGVYSETSKEARKVAMSAFINEMKSVSLNPGESKEVHIE